MIYKILSDTEHKIIPLKRKNEETQKVEKIKIDLYFKDVILLIKDIEDKIHKIKCKIIENLLFSENAGLSSDEHKALYLDFCIRHPKLKSGTKEFKDTIRTDSYFNAVLIKFGYAITCHKAQGSEWDNILLDCSYQQSQLSQGYFRWLYTAMTRASNALYVMNEPHIGIFDNVVHPLELSAIATVIYDKINDIILNENIEIISKDSKQYKEIYHFKKDKELATFDIYYNSKNIVSTINPHENNNLTKLLQELLARLVNRVIVNENGNDFTFTEEFLENFYLALKDKLSIKNINIDSIRHMQYKERYYFSIDNRSAVIDFSYNGRKQFTCKQMGNASNPELFNQIIELM